MDKINNAITGATGIGAIEVAGQIQEITEGGGLILQIVVAIVTLIKMLKKKKDATNEKL